MKKLSNVFIALAFVSLTFFMSCGGSDDGPTLPDLTAEGKKLLTASPWKTTQVTDPSKALKSEEWKTFKITFTDDKYTTEGVPPGFEKVWPASGTWKYVDNKVSTISRDGSLNMTSAVSDKVLSLKFTFKASGRTNSIDGDWDFILGK